MAQAKVARKSGWRGVNLKFVVLVALSSRSSRTFFHVFPELSRSIGNAASREKDSRVARFPTGMCALEPPHQQHGEQALPTEGWNCAGSYGPDRADPGCGSHQTEGRCSLEPKRGGENVSPSTPG